MKTPNIFKKTSLLTVVLAASLVFLAVVLVISAVSQFSQGHCFSGCVSILGVLLVGVACSLLIPDLRKKTKQDGECDG